MMNERALFDAALEIENPAKRRAFVEKACAGDQELLLKVTSLLEAHEQANSFLENPALNLQPQDLNKTAQASHIEKTSDFSIGQSDEAFAKTETRNNESDDDEEKVDLSFLKPPTKTGSIGSLGHYEILQVLGQGGFGVVFKAFDEKLHRLVAIKVMNPQMAATSPPRKRFLREARAVAAIKNENVVQVYSVEEQPLPYMVMEFIDGQTLQQKLDGNGPLDVNEVLYLGRQMVNALAAAHGLGIIHRDIKPGNILLEQGAEQKVKITDFGLARAADDASMTRTGLISGTPLYMSPEQALGQQLDPRSDLFSLGSVLYQMACGRAPFRAPTAIAVLRRVADETPRPIQQILPELPDWLAALIVKLHAKKPEDRFQSAKELADLMARYQSELQLQGKVTSFTKDEPSPAVAETSKDGAPQVAVATQTLPTKKKVNKGLIGAIAALIAVAVLSPFLIPRNRSQDVAPNPDSPSITSTTTATGWQGWPADAPPPAIAPFNAEQAKQHQEAWAKYLNVPVEYTNSIGMKFRLIPPGEFMMGSTKEQIEKTLERAENLTWKEFTQSESPQHKVILSRPVYLGVNEVTQAEYEKVVGSNPSHFAASGVGKEAVNGIETASHPVETVSWNDAADFCANLSMREKLKPFYFRAANVITPLDGTGFRLPTEAEWECACRAGTTVKYCIGEQDEDLVRVGWFGSNSGQRTHAVGELRGNPFHLFDMLGNVWEWVQDEWDPAYYRQFQYRSAIDPVSTSPSKFERLMLMRGGNYSWISSHETVSTRFALPAVTGDFVNGFRVALPVDAVRTLLKLAGPAIPKSQANELSNTTPVAESSNSKSQVPNAASVQSMADSQPESDAGVVSELDQLRGYSLSEVENTLPPWPENVSGKLPKPLLAPYSSEQAKEGQAAWAKALERDVVKAGPAGMQFVLIPPGEFDMWWNEGPESAQRDRSQPVVRTRLPKAYELSQTEVTYEQFAKFVEATGYVTVAEKMEKGGFVHFGPPADGKSTWRQPTPHKVDQQHPVVQITAEDAHAYCAWLSTVDKAKYRLPTETEFQHALLAGSQNKHVPGERPEELNQSSVFVGKGLQIVGSRPANPFGLFDMVGNVWEHCSASGTFELFDAEGVRSPNPETALRGSTYMASSATPAWNAAFRIEPIDLGGFRVLRELEPKTADATSEAITEDSLVVLVRRGQPLVPHAYVRRPEPIPGVRSWSIELTGDVRHVEAVAADPNGDLIATGDSRGHIRLWDGNGKLQRVLIGHEGLVSFLNFSPDGQWLLSGDRSARLSTARLWHVTSGRQLAVIPQFGWPLNVEFGPGSQKILIAGGMSGLKIYDRTSGSLTNLRQPTVVCATWSSTGKEIALHTGTQLQVLNVDSQKVQREVQCRIAHCVAWSPDGKWLAVCSAGASVEIRNADSLELVSTLKATETAGIVSWLPDSKHLAVAAQSAACGVFDTTTGEQTAKFTDGGNVFGVALRNEGREAVLKMGQQLQFYDTETGKLLRQGNDFSFFTSTSIDPRESKVYSATDPGKLLIHNVETGQFESTRSLSVAVASQYVLHPSPTGAILAFVGLYPWPEVHLVDTASGKTLRTLTHGQEAVTQIAWSPEGNRIATAAKDNHIRLWNTTNGQVKHDLIGHVGPCYSLAWAPDGKRLISMSEDKTVRLWDTENGNLLRTFQEFPFPIHVDPTPQAKLIWKDQSTIWIALGIMGTMLNVNSGEFSTLEDFSNGRNAVDGFSLSADGQRLLCHEAYGWTTMRGSNSTDRYLLGQWLGGYQGNQRWCPDNRRFIADQIDYGTIAYDTERHQRLGTLFPQVITRPDPAADHKRAWLCIGPTGHVRGGPTDFRPIDAAKFPPEGNTPESLAAIEDLIVYVAMLEDGSQQTFTHKQFVEKFGWKNDPSKATLSKLQE